MKIALIAEWLETYAGSERVLEQMIHCFPSADLFAVIDVIPDEERGFLQGKIPKVTFIEKLPGAKKHFRHYLPLMPLAIEQLDLSGYDLIISNSHAVSKGILVGPDQVHISYVHSPMRYAWDLQHQYLRESGLDQRLRGWIARIALHYLRLWDLRTVPGVDHFVANSHFIGRRIKRVYGRSSTVIYPPIDIESFPLQREKTDVYVTASRMVPYKRMDLIVEAFSKMPEKRLIVIGDGPEMEKIKKLSGSNITLLGYQPIEVLKEQLQKAKAFIFAAEEDFGIVPLEAQATGTPVIAFGKGGALETVIPPGTDKVPTGLFFEEQTVASLIEAIHAFEAIEERFDPEAIRRHAEQFSIQRFNETFKNFVDEAYKATHLQRSQRS